MPNIAVETCIVNPRSIDEHHVHVVAGVIWREIGQRSFLIAQRQAGKHLAGYWEFPGGKVESGERPRDALRRELIEEISIEPIACEPFMQVYYRYPEKNVLLDFWQVAEYDGVVEAGEQQALAWIEIEQIDAYRFPPADVPVLEALRRLERTAS